MQKSSVAGVAEGPAPPDVQKACNSNVYLQLVDKQLKPSDPPLPDTVLGELKGQLDGASVVIIPST